MPIQFAAIAKAASAGAKAYAAKRATKAAIDKVEPVAANAIEDGAEALIYMVMGIAGAGLMVASLGMHTVGSFRQFLGDMNPIGLLMSDTQVIEGGSAYGFEPLTIHTPFLIDQTPPGSYDFTLADSSGSTSVKVPSPCQGKIVASGSWGGYGNGLDLRCGDGMVVRMTHFASLSVTTGASVQLGQPLGVQGTTGNSTGDHVHLEITLPGQKSRSTARSITRPIVEDFFAFWRAGQTATASTGSNDPLLDRVFTAITQKESGGDCTLMNASGSQATGIGQVMPANIPSWTQAALGRSLTQAEFLADCNAQIQTVKHRLGLYLDEELANTGGDEATAVKRVAARWYSGRAELYTSWAPQYWNGDDYPSIAEYANTVASNAGF